MGEVGMILGDDGLAISPFLVVCRRGGEILERLERAWGAPICAPAPAITRLASTVAKLGHLAAASAPPPQGMFLGLCGAFAWQLTGDRWQEAEIAVTSGVYDPVRGRYLEHV